MVNRKRLGLHFLNLIIGDQVVLHGSFVAAFLFRYSGSLPEYNFQPYIHLAPWISVVFFIYAYIYELYSAKARRWEEEFASIILVIFLTILSSIGLSYLARYFSFPRTVFAIAAVLQLLTIASWRYLMHRNLLRQARRQRLIIVGEAPDALKIAEDLTLPNPVLGEVIGLVLNEIPGLSQTESGQGEVITANNGLGHISILGKWSEIEQVIEEYRPDAIILCSSLNNQEKMDIVYRCLGYNLLIWVVPSIYDILLTKSRFTQLGDNPICEIPGPVVAGRWTPFKRILDVTLAAIMIILTFPLMVIVAVAIKLDSPGTVLYKQKRVTEGGREFLLYKFRTMITGAEKMSGPVLAKKGDPRVTRIGRFLRSTRIDELPQLFNVLRGDMSIVGPRPERPHFVKQYLEEIPGYEHRLKVKGGITGLAQVVGSYHTSTEKKILYDMIYARSCSPVMDIYILLQTLKVMMLKDRAG
ncbi:MAG: sugar transferase [Syntrophomonadaceae bacterium]|nr:sugar transferase [Syntrophomonadaceae bacterium]